jgi:hypothetical protein
MKSVPILSLCNLSVRHKAHPATAWGEMILGAAHSTVPMTSFKIHKKVRSRTRKQSFVSTCHIILLCEYAKRNTSYCQVLVTIDGI